ncbi:MAG: hypothetical protein GY861_14640 [bacterium]|nr:hypothetical protein [bacterium]
MLRSLIKKLLSLFKKKKATYAIEWYDIEIQQPSLKDIIARKNELLSEVAHLLENNDNEAFKEAVQAEIDEMTK